MSLRTFVVGLFLFYSGIALNHMYTQSINDAYLAGIQQWADTLKVEQVDMVYVLNTIEVTDPVYIADTELTCMQKNIYWESRNQRDREGWAAVAYVVLNRVADSRYPSSICGVVKSAKRDDKGNPIRDRCAFSWHCNGQSDIPNLTHPGERAAWDEAGMIAELAILGEIENPVGDALFYHADYVNPRWASVYTRVAQIDDHIFYRTVHL